MSARWITFFVWAAVAASALFWGLKLLVQAPPAPPQVQVADGSDALRGDLTRLLGTDAPAAVVAAEAAPAADARFSLLGVVSPRSPQAAREGVALIAVDGKPAKAFRIGSVVDGQTVLQSVQPRGASLGPRDGPSQIALRIEPPAAAATGTLPPPQSQFQMQSQPGLPTLPPPAVPPQMQPPPDMLPQQQAPGISRPGNLQR